MKKKSEKDRCHHSRNHTHSRTYSHIHIHSARKQHQAGNRSSTKDTTRLLPQSFTTLQILPRHLKSKLLLQQLIQRRIITSTIPLLPLRIPIIAFRPRNRRREPQLLIGRLLVEHVCAWRDGEGEDVVLTFAPSSSTSASVSSRVNEEQERHTEYSTSVTLSSSSAMASNASSMVSSVVSASR